MDDPDALLARLIREEFEFVLIGGFAVLAHGGSMRTQDIDVCCCFSQENLARLLRAVEDLNPVHRMTPDKRPLGCDSEAYVGWKNLYIGTTQGQLDCLGEIKGVGSYDAALEQSVEIELPSGPCRVLSLDALIRSKEAMGGPRDQAAVLELRAIKERLGQGG